MIEMHGRAVVLRVGSAPSALAPGCDQVVEGLDLRNDEGKHAWTLETVPAPRDRLARCRRLALQP
jgi:hypothetical protein